MGISNWEYLALKIVDKIMKYGEAAPFINCSMQGEVDWTHINDYPGIKMQPTDLNLI